MPLFVLPQPEACKLAVQLKGEVLPIKQPKPRYKAREITAEEKKYSVFQAMRIARADARLVGIREKRARQKAEEERNKPKKK